MKMQFAITFMDNPGDIEVSHASTDSILPNPEEAFIERPERGLLGGDPTRRHAHTWAPGRRARGGSVQAGRAICQTDR